MLGFPLEKISSLGILIFFLFFFFYHLIKYIRNKRRYSLLSKRWSLKKIKKMSWVDFELLCAEYFRSKGWKATTSEKLGADGGIDIELRKFGKRALVQCKRYDQTLVRVTALREFYAVMIEADVKEGYFITSSRFTKECYGYVENKNISLIEGSEIPSIFRL